MRTKRDERMGNEKKKGSKKKRKEQQEHEKEGMKRESLFFPVWDTPRPNMAFTA